MKKLTLATIAFSSLFFWAVNLRNKTVPNIELRIWIPRWLSPKAGDVRISRASYADQLYGFLAWPWALQTGLWLVTEMDKIGGEARWERCRFYYSSQLGLVPTNRDLGGKREWHGSEYRLSSMEDEGGIWGAENDDRYWIYLTSPHV